MGQDQTGIGVQKIPLEEHHADRQCDAHHREHFGEKKYQDVRGTDISAGTGNHIRSRSYKHRRQNHRTGGDDKTFPERTEQIATGKYLLPVLERRLVQQELWMSSIHLPRSAERHFHQQVQRGDHAETDQDNTDDKKNLT